jgi:hypothetical protein
LEVTDKLEKVSKLEVTDKLGKVSKLEVTDKLGKVSMLEVTDKLVKVSMWGVTDKLGKVSKLGVTGRLGKVSMLEVTGRLGKEGSRMGMGSMREWILGDWSTLEKGETRTLGRDQREPPGCKQEESTHQEWECKACYQPELEEASSWASWATSCSNPSELQSPCLPPKAASGSCS